MSFCLAFRSYRDLVVVREVYMRVVDLCDVGFVAVKRLPLKVTETCHGPQQLGYEYEDRTARDNGLTYVQPPRLHSPFRRRWFGGCFPIGMNNENNLLRGGVSKMMATINIANHTAVGCIRVFLVPLYRMFHQRISTIHPNIRQAQDLARLINGHQ